MLISFRDISKSDERLFQDFCERVEVIEVAFHNRLFILDTSVPKYKEGTILL